MKDFEVAGGTITGRDHLIAGKNNNDSFSLLISENVIVGIVCDGCTSGKHSEVGAKIAAKLIVELIMNRAKRLSNLELEFFDINYWKRFYNRILQDVLANLRILANNMGENLFNTIEDYFLFTVMGVLITSKDTIIASIGDGVFIINNEIIIIGPFPDNEPPYPAYNLINSTERQLSFSINKIIQTKEVQSVFIGTDGVTDLIKASNLTIPGKEEIIGKVSQFWENDFFFKNQDGINRKLRLVNRTVSKPNWDQKRMIIESGRLPDDTTLISIRRRKKK